MRIEELKERVFANIDTWAEKLLSDLTSGNPKLAVASVYLKKGLRNIVRTREEEIGAYIDKAGLFITDESGEVNIRTVFEDLMSIFKDMDEIPFRFCHIEGTIGKGAVRFQIPDNMIMTALFGNLGCIKITESDLGELVDLLDS